jgi:branched-chain amino acid transport system substrate-binding protein
MAALALLLAACGAGRADSGARDRRAAHGKDDLVVAVVWPWQQHRELRYEQGLELALGQINQGGGVHGRKLRLLRVDDGESVNQGRLVAERIARDPAVVAVIGHLQSYVTVPAAAIYDMAGLVHIAPAATQPELSTKGYTRLFRVIFTDRQSGAQMADLAAARGYRRVVIHYVRTDYGRALANAFEARAAERGLTVLARQSYGPQQSVDGNDFESLLLDWKRLEPDAIFLASEVPLAGQLIAAIRRAGITAAILGDDAMSSPALITLGGAAAEGTTVPSAFSADEPTPEAQRFRTAFRQRYGAEPDAASALGYDALSVLAEGMRRAPQPTPDAIARSLHGLRGWRGVTGPFTFDVNGDLVGREVAQLVVRRGRFAYTDASLVGAP